MWQFNHWSSNILLTGAVSVLVAQATYAQSLEITGVKVVPSPADKGVVEITFSSAQAAQDFKLEKLSPESQDKNKLVTTISNVQLKIPNSEPGKSYSVKDLPSSIKSVTLIPDPIKKTVKVEVVPATGQTLAPLPVSNPQVLSFKVTAETTTVAVSDVQIIAVEVKKTASGIEIALKPEAGQTLNPKKITSSTQDKKFTLEISDSTLKQGNRESWASSDLPAEIASVKITKLDGNKLQVEVVASIGKLESKRSPSGSIWNIDATEVTKIAPDTDQLVGGRWVSLDQSLQPTALIFKPKGELDIIYSYSSGTIVREGKYKVSSEDKSSTYRFIDLILDQEGTRVIRTIFEINKEGSERILRMELKGQRIEDPRPSEITNSGERKFKFTEY